MFLLSGICIGYSVMKLWSSHRTADKVEALYFVTLGLFALGCAREGLAP